MSLRANRLRSPSPQSTMRLAFLVVALILVPFVLAACEDEQTAALPALGARLENVSVSGFSSGAYMAGQFQFAHSRMVVGAGLVAGGPYGCAENAYAQTISGPGAAFFNLSQAINGCMLNGMKAWGIPNPRQLHAKALERAQKGLIDPLIHIADDRVYLFSGSKDRTVATPIVEATRALYRLAGVPDGNIKMILDLPAGHGFVTRNEGRGCGKTRAPYIVGCDYDQAGALLNWIHGPLKEPGGALSGRLRLFSQSPYTAGLKGHGMATTGFVYIPAVCERQGGCTIHVAFHGCRQNREKVGDSFARKSGYLRWADANAMIVLFPQVRISTLNPQACWDWWGYTGRDYLTQRAPQIVAVRRMLERLAGRRDAR